MNTVLIPLPDGRNLAMEIDTYREALARGQSIAPTAAVPQPASTSEVLDADGMAKRTNVPASWWLEAARRGDVPHIRAGKYVRFDLAAALSALDKR